MHTMSVGGGWATELAERLAQGDVHALKAATNDLGIEGYRVIVAFSERPLAGHAAGELLWIDRAFRWAARAAENDESLESLLARRGRPLLVADGMVLEALEAGSIRSVLSPSIRVATAGLGVLVGVVALITGGLQIADRLEQERPPYPGDEPYFVVTPPYDVRLTIEIDRRREQLVLEFERHGEFYAPVSDTPPRVDGP
jgi:hypothetical protein